MWDGTGGEGCCLGSVAELSRLNLVRGQNNTRYIILADHTSQ